MRVLIAIGASAFVHLILAAGLWWYFVAAPAPVVLAQLDLSSVELSLAEEDVVTATPVASLPSAAAPRSRTETPKTPVPQLEAVDPAMPALAEPVPPEAASVAPELPESMQPEKPSAVSPMPTPAVAPRQAKVEAPPSLKRAIRPDYPRGARLRREEGDVLLVIHVTADGGVGDVRVVGSSGFAELDEAAVRAAKAARFTPAKSGREDVASVARLKLTFKLR